MRNISETLSSPTPIGKARADRPADPRADRPVDRQTLQRELLEQMTAWAPGDRSLFRAWHRHALSLVHLNVLTALAAEGPLSMRRLAETMDVSDASATGIIDRLEKRGLVERRHGTEDRRTVLVHPTRASDQVLRDMAAQRRSVLTRVLTELSDEELACLLTGMRAMTAARRRVLDPAGGVVPSGDEPSTD